MAELESINKYYMQFVQLVALHQELGFGKNPHIPSVFSEKLVKTLFNYDNWDNRDFDAKSNDLGVEIKATGTRSGTTSINVDKLKNDCFSHLVWVTFDFVTHEATIKSISKDELLNDKKISDSNGRVNIGLSKYKADLLKIYKFKSVANKRLWRQ
jgi:hypothetical protein